MAIAYTLDHVETPDLGAVLDANMSELVKGALGCLKKEKTHIGLLALRIELLRNFFLGKAQNFHNMPPSLMISRNEGNILSLAVRKEMFTGNHHILSNQRPNFMSFKPVYVFDQEEADAAIRPCCRIDNNAKAIVLIEASRFESYVV